MSHIFRAYDAALADLFFRNLLDAGDNFKIVDNRLKPGYPVDIYFEGLDGDEKLAVMKFEFALPGVTPENVKITRNSDGELRVKFDKPENTVAREYVVRTISRKSFDLSWRISRKFDLSKLESVWKDGLLTISIPRSVETLPETVEVKIL